MILIFRYLIIFIACIPNAKSNDLPEGFTQKRIASNLDPTNIVKSPDGRIFLTLKNGEVRIIDNGILLSQPFMKLSVDSRLERGLQGLVFHPDFENNNIFYAYYTKRPQDNNIKTVNRLSKFTSNGNLAVISSEEVLLETDTLSYGYHNGGAMEFGLDGKLYICTGEGGDLTASQNLNNLNGKVLRINPDGSIPEDNPFLSETTGKYQAIYAIGLRNPFQSSIDPISGRIFAGDVGAATWEEINEIEAGANYGWPNAEGPSTTVNFTNPVISYKHDIGCAITGITYYAPDNSNFPQKYRNKLFYSDFCTGFIKVWDPNNESETLFTTGLQAPIALEVGSDGTLYYLTRGSYSQAAISFGELWQIKYVGQNHPYIVTHPQDQYSAVGEDATFYASANGEEPISIQWQKDGESIEGATSSTLTIENINEDLSNSNYRIIVSNKYTSDTSSYAKLIVSPYPLPTVTIVEPAEGTMYRAGKPIKFSGVAVGATGQELPSGWLSWKIDFHHDNHAHPALELTDGEHITFTLDTIGETSDNVWLRVYLRARDFSQATSKTIFKDIYPEKSEVTLTTEPEGLAIKLEGREINAPYTFTSVVGISRLIAPVSPIYKDGSQYIFSHWKHGKGPIQFISTPEENTTYTAVFDIVANNHASLNKAISFYPNPAKNLLTLNITSWVAEDITIEITDAMARVQLIKIISVSQGNNFLNIDVSPLKEGAYIMKMSGLSTNSTEKLLIK